MFYFAAIIIALAVSVAFATVGVDVSQPTSVGSFQCFRDYGYNFAIVRVYQSNGQCDPNGPATINNAWNGGMAHVDGYIFPCYSCQNPEQQMTDTVNYLNSHNVLLAKKGENLKGNSTLGATVGMLWLDVEGTQYWSGDCNSNINFLQRMVNQGHALGVSMGVYSSNSQWSPIMCGSSQFSSLPIWYPHYDLDYSFNDWYSFGGWGSPAIKQYAGDQYFCSAGVDKNYYP